MMPVTWAGWPEGGEIDIMEHVGCVPTEVSSSIHCKAYYHAINTQKTAAKKIATVMDEFHTYALEWTPEYIRTYVDGVQLFYYNPDDYPKGRNADTWPFNKPFQLKLNLAWGGDWGGMYGVDESCLPATFEIDYVRVFQKTE
jgi:beta-glucanase (GH16 family)